MFDILAAPLVPAVTPTVGCPLNPLACLQNIPNPVTSVVSSAADAGFSSIAKDFADFATSLLTSFAKAYESSTTLNLSTSGIGLVYALTMSIALLTAGVMIMGQAIRLAATHDGRLVASIFTGIVKFALAISMTLVVVGIALEAADALTGWIIDVGLGGTDAFVTRLSSIVKYDPQAGSALIFIFGIVGIIVTMVLFLELLFRNAAVLVLIGSAPISASGLTGGESTHEWWRKWVSATIHLVLLKPVIALVFAVGFLVTGHATDVQGFLEGLLILVLAVVAWPAIAGLFSFTGTQVGKSGGMGALLGAGAAAAGAAAGGVTAEGLGGYLEKRNAATQDAGSSSSGPSASQAAGVASKAAGSGGAAGGGAAAGLGAVAGPVAAGLAAVKGVADAAAGQMQNTAHHAGLGAPASPSSGGSGRPAAPAPSSESQSAESPPVPAAVAPGPDGSGTVPPVGSVPPPQVPPAPPAPSPQPPGPSGQPQGPGSGPGSAGPAADAGSIPRVVLPAPSAVPAADL